MASFVKFHVFVEHLAEKVHNLGSDTLKVALSNTAPDAAADTVFADISEISAGNGYTAGGTAVTVTTSAQSAGTYTLAGNQVTFTASGGSIGPFRYVILYNDTPSSPADPLIGYYDHGSSVTLSDTQALTVQFNSSNPGTILTLA